jgi:nucleoside-diphosphate-sugar epimerase
MRVFVTGASGWVGSAVTRDLIAAGHNVLGLARSDASAKAVTAAGGEVQRGALDDLDSLRRGAAACDGVIHTAFIHDFSNLAASAAIDTAAIETLGAVLAGSGRPLIVSSGMGTTPGRLGTEDDAIADAVASLNPRRSEQVGLAMAARGIRAMVVRLPPSTHGDGDQGLAAMLVRTAREKGFAFYVGDGKNRWPAVHRFDAARVYRLALESGTSGSRFHAVAEPGIPIREIAEVIGRRLNIPAVSQTPEEAVALLGFIGRVLAIDLPASSALTQERLGWHPTGTGLIADLEKGRYFDT